MDVIDRLTAALGEAVLTTEPSALDASCSDRSGWTAAGRPLALVNATRRGSENSLCRQH